MRKQRSTKPAFKFVTDQSLQAAGSSTPSLEQQNGGRALPPERRRVSTPAFTPMPSDIVDQADPADQQRAAIEHPHRIPIRTPAFTPMLGARSQARFVVMPEDPVKRDSVRRAKMLTPDLAALRTSDDARDVESILHAEALAAELDDDSSDESDAFEGDFDFEDDAYYYERPTSDGDEDVVSDEENGEPQPGSSKAGRAQNGSKRSQAGRKKKPEGQRAEEHAKLVDTGFAGFKCGCKRAEARGIDSCLDGISKEDLRAIHRDTYGNGSTVQLADVLMNIHRLYWVQAIPISKSRTRQRGQHTQASIAVDVISATSCVQPRFRDGCRRLSLCTSIEG
jgi:hypothetical protein